MCETKVGLRNKHSFFLQMELISSDLIFSCERQRLILLGLALVRYCPRLLQRIRGIQSKKSILEWYRIVEKGLTFYPGHTGNDSNGSWKSIMDIIFLGFIVDSSSSFLYCVYCCLFVLLLLFVMLKMFLQRHCYTIKIKCDGN